MGGPFANPEIVDMATISGESRREFSGGGRIRGC